MKYNPWGVTNTCEVLGQWNVFKTHNLFTPFNYRCKLQCIQKMGLSGELCLKVRLISKCSECLKYILMHFEPSICVKCITVDLNERNMYDNICLQANYSLIFNLFFDEIRKIFLEVLQLVVLWKSVRYQHVWFKNMEAIQVKPWIKKVELRKAILKRDECEVRLKICIKTFL